MLIIFLFVARDGLMVSALVSGSSSPGLSSGRGHCVVFLGKTLTLTVPLSTQEYKWVPANSWGNLTNCWGVPCDGLASRPEGVEIPLSASCNRNRDKLRQLRISLPALSVERSEIEFKLSNA